MIYVYITQKVGLTRDPFAEVGTLGDYIEIVAESSSNNLQA